MDAVLAASQSEGTGQSTRLRHTPTARPPSGGFHVCRLRRSHHRGRAGTLLAAGALGLLAGFAVPAIGTAAAVGLVLYFMCAAGAHLRVRDYQLGNVAIFLSLAVAALAMDVAT